MRTTFCKHTFFLQRNSFVRVKFIFKLEKYIGYNYHHGILVTFCNNAFHWFGQTNEEALIPLKYFHDSPEVSGDNGFNFEISVLITIKQKPINSLD